MPAKRIGIIFLADRWDPSYSIASVVTSQISTFVKNGYFVRVLMHRNAPPWRFPGQVEYRSCLPAFRVDPEQICRKQFDAQVKRVERVLAEEVSDLDLVITHDAMYHEVHLPFNAAIRRVAGQFSHLRWLHWVHSKPRKGRDRARRYPTRFCYQGMTNAKFICVTESDKAALKAMYRVPSRDVAAVYNARANSDFMQFDSITRKLVDKHQLLDVDIVTVMPNTLSRIGKQHEVCLFIMAALKQLGVSLRFIFANAGAVSKGRSEQLRILQLRWLSKKIGLTDEEVLFTSELDRRLSDGCPHSVVSNLFSLSNVYIHPSYGETCSLTLIEAAMKKNLCVLNQSVATFSEMAKGNALWFQFDSMERVLFKKHGKRALRNLMPFFHNYYLENQEFYLKVAKKIVKTLSKQKNLSLFTQIKKQFNERRVFETQLRPLIEKDASHFQN